MAGQNILVLWVYNSLGDETSHFLKTLLLVQTAFTSLSF